MTEQETLELLEFIETNYTGFEIKEGMLKAWHEVLQQYDSGEVKENLKKYMGYEEFQYSPPKVYLLVKGLQKQCDKVDFSQEVFLCRNCRRPFNSFEEMERHYDKCLDVDYIIKETKKWGGKELTRKELFQMPDEEFQDKYDKMLKFIAEHTNNESEKTRISFIFNPPSRETAKRFLTGTGD